MGLMLWLYWVNDDSSDDALLRLCLPFSAPASLAHSHDCPRLLANAFSNNSWHAMSAADLNRSAATAAAPATC
jgi:hypothetical protein